MLLETVFKPSAKLNRKFVFLRFDGCAILLINLYSLRSCPSFPVQSLTFSQLIYYLFEATRDNH